MIRRDICCRPDSGFTLLELLVVLAIAGLLMALVPPVVSAVVPGAKFRVAAHELAVTLRDARNQAISRSSTIDVTFEFEPSQYSIANDKAHVLPDDVEIVFLDSYAATSAKTSEVLNFGSGEKYTLRFYPDGSSNGATVRLGRQDSHYLIDVGWLMGRVTVSQVQAGAQ